MDNERVDRLQKIMAKEGIDVLLLRLPENVLYATGYWPVIGASLAVIPANGESTLIMPHSELDYAAAGCQRARGGSSEDLGLPSWHMELLVSEQIVNMLVVWQNHSVHIIAGQVPLDVSSVCRAVHWPLEVAMAWVLCAPFLIWS